MNNLEITNKKLELLKRTNKLLEETKLEFKKYEKERKLLLEFTQNSNPNTEQWEQILAYLESIINLDKNLNLKEADFNYLKDLANLLREQKVRKKDINDEKKNIIFKVTDKFNNTRLFLTRQKAEEYIANNKELKNSTIVIVNEKNDELEHLLNLIERNF
jgi:nicotinic acid phosphoribosyltransferase